MIIALTLWSYAAEPVAAQPITMNCADFLQLMFGGEDKPSQKYVLKIEKGADMDSPRGRIPTYNLRIDGFPKNKDFQIVSRNALGQTCIVMEGSSSDKGLITYTSPKDRPRKSQATCAPIFAGGFERGEPSQLLLVDLESGTTDAIFYVPYPSEPSRMGNLEVSMYWLGSNPPVHLFDVRNLIPGETFTTTLSTGNGSGSQKFVTPSGGAVSVFCNWLYPELPPKDASLEIERGGHKLIIQFPWIRKLANLPSPLLILTLDHSTTPREIEYAKICYLGSVL